MLPAGTDSDTSSSAGRRRPGYVKRTRTISSAGASPSGASGDTPGSVRDGDRLGMDGVKTLGRGEGVRELASHLGDLPHRDEGGQREQRQERHDPGVQGATLRESRAGDGDGEAAQPRRDLLQGALTREVSKERHPGLRVGLRAGRELPVPPRLLLERRHLREPLNGVDGMGVE